MDFVLPLEWYVGGQQRGHSGEFAKCMRRSLRHLIGRVWIKRAGRSTCLDAVSFFSEYYRPDALGTLFYLPRR